MNACARILTIGSELLRGNVLNSNARYLGQSLTELGFTVQSQTACPDDLRAIQAHMAQILESPCRLAILSGGLGPTPDDMTRDAVAAYFRVPLIFSKNQFRLICQHYRRYGYAVPPEVRKEAFYPQNAVPLTNRHGIAVGFYLKVNGQLIIVLPGVPTELEKMFKEAVRPLIRAQFRGLRAQPRLTAKIIGLSEPAIITRLGKDFFNENFDFGIYPEAGEVVIRISSESAARIARLRSKIEKRLGRWIYSFEEQSFYQAVGKELLKKRQTLAVAESCTGGVLASEMTKIAGASRYFNGGLVAYNNRIKESLGISQGLLKKKGAVSREVALMLAKLIRRHMNSSYGIGITGIAGPAGGSRLKPVGLVFIAVASQKGASVRKHLLFGDRNQIQLKASKKALEHLWQKIR